jgi:hypothetical protein
MATWVFVDKKCFLLIRMLSAADGCTELQELKQLANPKIGKMSFRLFMEYYIIY